MIKTAYIMFNRWILSAICLLLSYPVGPVLAQSIAETEGDVPAPVGEWRALSSFNFVQDLATDSEGRIWGVTTGGIFIWNPNSSRYEALLTPIEGLTRMDPSVITYYPEKDLMLVGFPDGGLNVIHPGTLEIQELNDIKRTQLYMDKRIQTIDVTRDGILIGTGFGIVKYDAEVRYVEQTFSSLGSFTDGTAVRDLVIDEETHEVWVATDQGVAMGNLSNDLSIAENWRNESSAYFGGAATLELALFQNKIYVTTSDGNYERFMDAQDQPNGGWVKNQTFGSVLITDYHVDRQANRLYAVYMYSLFYLDENVRRRTITIPELGNVVHTDGSIWIGSFQNGLIHYDESNETADILQVNGPAMNAVFGLRFTDNGMISGSTRFSNRTFLFDDLKGFSIVRDGVWTNYNMSNRDELRDTYFTLTYLSLAGEGYAYFGSWGSGIARLNLETDEINVFNAQNTSIRGANSSNYVVISGLEKDSQGGIWAVSRYATRPLIYHVEGSEEWTTLAPASILSSSDRYMRMVIDSNDQKWITLESASEAGRGLMVLNTGQDPLSASDDRAVTLTTGIGSGNLPDATVTAILEDQNGEMWIGTERGVAKFTFPDLILDGGPAERQAQWLIADDPGVISPFLLRDISVTAMAVNGANQKWIGTTSDGLWLVNEQGSRVLAHYTAENSPLLSSSVYDLAYNATSGELYITTALGVVILTDVSIRGTNDMTSLSVYPNPFVYDRHDRVIVEGLSERSTLFVITVDGVRVRRLDTAGGRVSWDGLDDRGQKLSSGIYLLVAKDENGGERGAGKIAIIR